MKRIVPLILLFASFYVSWACQCPITELTLEETRKYDIIFRGTVKKVKPCGSTPGEAHFIVEELFRGRIPKELPVIFDCSDECSVGFHEGEEWIIYTHFRQISSARMDWCSRSRKYYRREQEDFYMENTGITYFDELAFLRKNLGHQRPIEIQRNDAGNRNQKPNVTQIVILLIFSALGIVVFYLLFRRFLR